MTTLAGPEDDRPEGNGAAPQDPQSLRAQRGPAPDGRGRLSAAAQRRPRCRPRDGLSRAHAVRAGRLAEAPSFRIRQGGVRAEPGPSSRSPGLHQLRPCRGIPRPGDRGTPEPDREERGFTIREHALYLYAECVKEHCPHRLRAVQRPPLVTERSLQREALYGKTRAAASRSARERRSRRPRRPA